MNEKKLYLSVEFKCRSPEEVQKLLGDLQDQFDFLVDGDAQGPFISAVQAGPLDMFEAAND